MIAIFMNTNVSCTLQATRRGVQLTRRAGLKSILIERLRFHYDNDNENETEIFVC